jgi:hypothetical protein
MKTIQFLSFFNLILIANIGIAKAETIQDDSITDSTVLELIEPPYGYFDKLDKSNTLSSKYKDFEWRGWKLAVAFINPPITNDSLKRQNRIFQDLSSKRTFYTFLINEIEKAFRIRTYFSAIRWESFTIKSEADTLEYDNEKYVLFLPDSAKDSYWRTGCRFALFLQYFTPKIYVPSNNSLSLMYVNINPEACQFDKFKNTKMIYSISFKYLIYDLLEDRVVQFGKAFDEDESETTREKDLLGCLEDAIFDVIQISDFYNK